MRFRGRRDGAAVATYAAVLDGVHLWLDLDDTVRSRARHRLRRASSSSASSPTTWAGSPGRPTTCWSGKAPVRFGRLHPSCRWPGRRSPRTASPSGTWSGSTTAGCSSRGAPCRRPPCSTRSTCAATGCTCGSGRPPRSSPAATCCCSTPTTRCSRRCRRPRHEGLLETLISVDDLPAGYFGVLRLAVGTDDVVGPHPPPRQRPAPTPTTPSCCPSCSPSTTSRSCCPTSPGLGCAGTRTACWPCARSTRTRPASKTGDRR